MPEPEQPWFQRVEDSTVQQGEILRDFPIVQANLRYRDGQPVLEGNAIARAYDVVVLTQSCDLDALGKIENVLLCPCPLVTPFAAQNPNFDTAAKRSAIQKGRVEGLYMISPCTLDGFTCETRIVNFKQVVTVPEQLLRDVAAFQIPRVRLASPYREHLSQAFARFIMRVGLPVQAIDSG